MFATVVVVIALAAGAWLVAGRSRAVTPAAPPEEAPIGAPALPATVSAALAKPGGLVVAWTAHAGARLEPCGCVAGMHGGLVRRATLLARAPRERTLRLELGGWSGGAVDYQLVRAEFFLRGLAGSGIDALGIGGAEVKLGAAKLRRLAAAAASAKVQLANANVTASDGQQLGAKLVRIERSGHAIAVTAVAPQGSGDGLTASDPAEAVAALLPQLNGAELVVLADLDAAGCEALARAVPGVALVVGGDVHDPSPAPVRVGAARVAYAANDGKTLGWWPWGGDQLAFELIDDHMPDRPAVRALVHDYQEAIGAMDLELDERLTGMTALAGSERSDARYVGSTSCRDCHAQAHAIHAASGHARSFAALEAKNYQRDPDCLRCHVVGLSLPDGYRRKEPRAELAQVGCESCHGRGSIHVAERRAARAASGTLTPVTPATCLRCHDPENSPQFDYTTYWERIRHDAR